MRVCLLAALLLCAYFTHAQSGIIKGIVADLNTNERLPGATVTIAGSAAGTSSDLDGEFVLRSRPGTVELVVSYLGFTQQILSVEVGEGVTEVTVKMTADARQLGDVVVTGALQGQQRALNQQRSADNIKNIISADQIGRFPDPNVAEALQRVPAVNIERDQGEGRYVLVRGLAPQFTNISINGEQIPSPEAGVRFVALDAVPADQLSSIEVSKALTPDMDGDAIGGSVNLITRKAQSEDISVHASAVLGYNNIVGRTNLQGSLEVSRRLLNNKLGIMLNGSYYESDRGSDNWERDGDEFELRDYELVRTRGGLSTTIDYQFDQKNEVYFRTIYNRFTDREQRKTYLFIPSDSPFDDPEIERASKDRLEKQVIASYNLGGKHTFTKFNLDYEVAYARAYQDTPYDVEVVSIADFNDIRTDFTTNRYFPRVTVDDPEKDFLSNSVYEFDEVTMGRTYALDENKTARFNIGIPFRTGSADGLIKFGAKVRMKQKSYDVTENVFGYTGDEDLTLDQFEGGSGGRRFLGGRYTIRPNADSERFIRFFNNNLSDFELDVEGKQTAEALETYSATEDVYAAYAMGRIQLNKLMLLGGVRYELTRVGYNSSQVTYDFEEDFTIGKVSGNREYGFILPQVHARYQLDNQTNIRAAVTFSYARPNFEDIVPSQEIEFSAREGTIGNPLLKPVAATNFDLLAEKYFGTVGILSGGVFYKRLNDFIFTRRFDVTNYPGAEGTTLTLNQAQNGENASLLGFELAYQRNLNFLPGFLRGLSVYVNYTFTTSGAHIQSREADQGTEQIRLPGQARHLGNFSLGYDYKRFNIRLSANFNGEYISEIGSEADEDLYVSNRMQLDATASYAVNRRLRVFGEFLNITNQPFQVYEGDKSRFIQREFYSWWSRVGVKLDF